jgi:hypothetical protein
MKTQFKRNLGLTIIIKIMGLIILVFSSCEKTMEYYLGIPMQPKFLVNTGWNRAMNVFGIIRPDSVNVPMSFVYLVQTTPTENDTFNDPTIRNATVYLYETNQAGITDSIQFYFYESGSENTWRFPRYIPKQLEPKGGYHYSLECRYPGLPTVTADTKMPYEPQIITSSLSVSNSEVRFDLTPDSLAYLYDIYLFSNNDSITKRYINLEHDTLKVDWQTGIQDQWKVLVICAYDKNLAEYLSTATNSFLSFNAYRPPVTTLNGGFGCFGSMNYKEYMLY